MKSNKMKSSSIGESITNLLPDNIGLWDIVLAIVIGFLLCSMFSNTSLIEGNKKKKEKKKEKKKAEKKKAKKEAKKEAKKNKKKNSNSQSNTPVTLNGLTRPMSVKKELGVFLHKPLDTKMSRTETAKEVAKYIKKNKLNKEENKMYWVPDETLQSILEPLNEKDKEKGGYSYFNLQRYISHLFIKE